jgi:myo-inositol-1-phosphate synthase
VRCCKLALNHGLGGQLDGPSSYLMKSPARQRPDDQARADTESFIARYTGRPAARTRRTASAAKTGAKRTGSRAGRAGAAGGSRAGARH